jgi:hypothetical protein
MRFAGAFVCMIYRVGYTHPVRIVFLLAALLTFITLSQSLPVPVQAIQRDVVNIRGNNNACISSCSPKVKLRD